MKETVTRIAPLFIPIGLVLIAIGAVTALVTRTFDLATNALLIGGAMLLLAFVIIRQRQLREQLGGRRMRYGTLALFSTLFVTVLAIFIYYVAYNNVDWRADLTETDRFTPLPETVQLLNEFDEPLQIIAFVSAASPGLRDQVATVLESLRAENERLTYEVRDPGEVPEELNQYDLEGNGLVFIRGTGEEEQVTTVSIVGSVTDSDVHSALARLVNPVEKTLYFLTGHGERNLNDTGDAGLSRLRLLLENQGFTVTSLDLFTAGAVPADASAVAIVGQQAPMPPEEVSVLADYLQGGGSLLVARDVYDPADPAAAEGDDLAPLLQQSWGVTIRSDVIIDVAQAAAGQTAADINFLATDFGVSPIVSDDLRDLGLAFYVARSVAVSDTEGIQRSELVRTSSNSWAESNIQGLATGQVSLDEADVEGPVTVAVSAEDLATGARLVALGDADLASNFGITVRGNSLFMTNALNWLAGEEANIELTPRETVDRRMFIPTVQLNILAILSVCIGPLITLLAGAAVWYRRRS